MVALERAGIPVERYVAYEIEPNAIKISQKNYPQIEQCGDVTTADFTQYEGFDLLIGGSPCQDLSNYKYDRGDVKGLEGDKSRLFYHYVRALKECRPKYFLLENVASMEQKWSDIISEELGVQPIMINSDLLSAQLRKRLYWTNIPGIKMPIDKGILLKDIVVSAENVPEKYWYDRPFVYNGDNEKVQATLQGPGLMRNMRECYNLDSKCNTLLCDGDGGNRQKKIYQAGRCRKLMPIEYERLQTLSDNYTEGIADSHRYTTTGNGWTVDVIAHIFTYLKEKEKKEMEFKINEMQLPAPITFNYEELKQEIEAKVSMYANLVYTDEQIQEAKKDKAALNKLKKALNDERIRMEKEYLAPFNVFKAQVNEIIGIIDKPVAVIDKQVKEYEEKQKREKKSEIEAYWYEILQNDKVPEAVSFSQIFNEKWLNASVSMKSIKGEIDARLEQIANDHATLQNLPEFGFEAMKVYESTLDLNRALNEGRRLSEIAKAKAAHEAEMKARAEEQARLAAEAEEKTREAVQNLADAAKATATAIAEGIKEIVTEPQEVPVIPPMPMWVAFQARLTTEQAKELKQFFDERNIEFRPI